MWGGSKVPPRMPRRTGDRIGQGTLRGSESQCAGGDQTTRRVEGRHVHATNPERDVHCLPVMSVTAHTDLLPLPDPLPDASPHLLEIGVRGTNVATVIDRDRQPPGDRTGEGHRACCHRPDRRSRDRAEVDAPVAAVRPDRGKAGDHGAADRRHERAGEDGESEREDWHVCECRATATTNLSPEHRRGKGPGGPSSQAVTTCPGVRLSRSSATERRSSGRNGLVRKASAPSRSARCRVSSWA